MEIGRAAHAVVDLPVLERVGALHPQPAWLERAEARRDHDRPRHEPRARRSLDREGTVVQPLEARDLLAEMELGLERLDLLQQPIHQLLRATHRQGRNVVDRLVGVELRALPARMPERVDDVRLDAQQAELERLEQAGRARPDDHGLCRDRRTGGAGNVGWGVVRQGHLRLVRREGVKF